MVLGIEVQDCLKKQCPELSELPPGWTFNIADTDYRVYFIPPTRRETTHNHPTHGCLPEPWILKVVENDDGKRRVMYYNPETQKRTTENPRLMASNLAEQSNRVSCDLWIAASTIKNSKNHDPRDLKRTPICYDKSIRDQYFEVHAIDTGDGSIGGMNGGVFVVAMKGLKDRVFIEKRVKPVDVSFGKKEIEMLHRLNHSALCNFLAGFILEDTNPQASLYMEFCDRGSLEGLIKSYSAKRMNGEGIFIPEGFVWHALVGLADGLAYLECGNSIWNNSQPVPNWIPILHRDIKPDNIMLKSRATLGSKKYFYCILSDFGLACDDRDDKDPLADKHQVARFKLGTKTYWAPELLYDPYPQRYGPQAGDQEIRYPSRHRHTKYSDLWALGASIYNLCVIGDTASRMPSHINLNRLAQIPGMIPDRYLDGTDCRVHPLRIPRHYSRILSAAILTATDWDPCERPSPVRFVSCIRPFMNASGFANHGDNYEPLPEWATNVHDYLAKAENIRKRNGW